MNTSSLVQKVWNFCHTLRDAFARQLVPEVPNEEPASVLLVRIRAERGQGTQGSKRRLGKQRNTR